MIMTKEMHWRAMIRISPTRAKPKVAVQTGSKTMQSFQ